MSCSVSLVFETESQWCSIACMKQAISYYNTISKDCVRSDQVWERMILIGDFKSGCQGINEWVNILKVLEIISTLWA